MRSKAMIPQWMPYLLIGAGGCVGAIARWLMTRWIDPLAASRFPVATFTINVLGSFLLGVLGVLVVAKGSAQAEAWRLALGVGFLGAFTTFSTFEFETHSLIEDRAWLLAAGYVLLSCGAGLAAVRAGVVLAKAWL
jgi:fluoride exporter